MFTTPADAPLLVLIGIGTGILGALLGTGGGVFLIPLLVLGFKVPMHFAIATSIVSVIATSSAVASVNVERGTANMRLGMTLEIGTSLGAITGGLTAHWLAANTLEILFAIVLAPTAYFMWRGRGETAIAEADTARTGMAPGETTGLLGGHYLDEQAGKTIAYRVRRLWAGLLVSFAAGSLSGLLGIGGGVFKVPALHLLCGVPIKAAAATSNFMIGVTAAASAFIYYGRGEVRPAMTASVVLGVLVGSAAGSYLNRFLHGSALRKAFAILLGAVAAQMIYRAWTTGV